jgi:hypothetical protein
MCKYLFLRGMQTTRALCFTLPLLLLWICPAQAFLGPAGPPKDTVIIMTPRGKYIPFTFLQKPVLEIRNGLLNITVTDRDGNMIQVNGISSALLTDTIVTPRSFRTVYITNKATETYTDAHRPQNCILDIRCAGNTPGSPVTFGLKTTVKKNNKTYRIYATLSGTVPEPVYSTRQSN